MTDEPIEGADVELLISQVWTATITAGPKPINFAAAACDAIRKWSQDADAANEPEPTP